MNNSEEQPKQTNRPLHKSARKTVLTLERKASRLGMSKRQYIAFRAERNLQHFVDGMGFNLCVAALILVSVILIFAEFLLPPGPMLVKVMNFNDIVTWIFVVELGLRYIVAPNKRIFFENFWIDILAVLPVLRVFRTLRLFRLLRLLRLTRAAVILLRQSGWLSARLERYCGSFGVLMVTAVMLVVCGTLALLTMEDVQGNQVIPPVELFTRRIWQTAFLFISGEIVGELPASPGAKTIALLISISGLVIFAVMVGTISAAMASYFRTKMDVKDLSLKDLKDHVIICGWDRMGGLILSELESVTDLWHRGVVVVAETDEDIAHTGNLTNPRRLFHIKDDFTKIDVLEAAGASRARSAIVLADKGSNLRDQDRDARTVLAALTLEKVNPKIFTCAELLDAANATHLKIAGVEEIISRTSLTAGLFATTLVNQGISSVISDLLTHKTGAYLRKFSVPADFVGHDFIEVFDYFKRQYDATIMAIDSNDDGKGYSRNLNPPHNRQMEENDLLVVVARVDSVFKGLTV